MKNLQGIIDRMCALAEEYDRQIERGQAPPLRVAQNLMVACRMYARVCMGLYNAYLDEYRSLRHAAAKAEHDGITFLPAKVKLEACEKIYKHFRFAMASAGRCLIKMLDLWQDAGASYDDLLRFCGADYPGMHARIRNYYSEYGCGEEERSFSELVFVHNLDYKNPRETGRIENEVDAPMTHCMKWYWFYKVVTEPIAADASTEAAQTVFSDIWENALPVHTNEDGGRELYDKDGVCIANLDSKEDDL